MSHLKSSGEGLPAFENDSSADSNPYAYPYFHCNGTSSLVYDLVVHFARHWNEVVDDDKATRMELQLLVKKIQFRCSAQPMEASWRDSCGDTALHRLCQVARFPFFTNLYSMTCFARLLVDVAEALIEAHPGSATKACNNWKETPLHQFCSHCGFPNNMNDEHDGDEDITAAPENPMMDLLKLLSKDHACALRNCWGSFPLHDACGLPGWEVSGTPIWRHIHIDDSPLLSWMKQQHCVMIEYLISQNVKAVGLRVEGGQTPLHRAFQSLKCSTNVIQMLLSHYNSDSPTLLASLSALWKHYKDFASLFWIEESYTYEDGVRVPKDVLIASYGWNHVPSILPDPQAQLESLGVLWEMTVLALNKLSLHNPQRILHAAVSAKDCPLYVIQLVIRLHPEQLLVKDEGGCTPLVLAIANKCSEDVVNSVLQSNLRAASIPDSAGRLPLCLAVETRVYSYHDMLHRLFAAEPSAVTTRDPVTTLFPFALAATAVDATRNDEEERLSSIFELLRVDPSALTQQ